MKDVLLYEDDFQTLKGLLVEEPSKLEPICIYGMPGLGKRTLARRLYDDPVIANLFALHAWVNASVEAEVKGTLITLLDILGVLTREMQSQTADQLGLHLRRTIGSKILFTAWNWDGCNDFESLGPYNLRYLNVNESWLLFCQKVFGQDPCPDELLPFGKIIVSKCKGISQVISVIAGLLVTSEKTPTLWRLVEESMGLALRGVEDHYKVQETLLRFIYNHLPYWLKPCFLYVGAFNECCDIRASKIAKLWIAEGFVKQIGNNSLENIAEAYLKILIDKNLLILIREECTGKVKAFQIQPFVRMFFLTQSYIDMFLEYWGLYDYDLEYDEDISEEDEDVPEEDEEVSREDEDYSEDDDCVSEEDEVSWEDEDYSEDDDCVRRISYHLSLQPSKETKLPSHVRSFLSIGRASLAIRLAHVFLGSMFLRVLDVFQLEFYQFPKETLCLLLLRYLAFGCHPHLRSSFSILRNLQSLIIQRIPSFRAFSLLFDLWGIAQLRHVKCKATFVLYYPDPENGKGTVHEKLQTLLNMQLFGVTNEFLRRIPNIRKLGIYCNIKMHNVLDLSRLEKLERLKCSSDWSLASRNFLSYLTFPLSLIKLTLSLCRIPWGFMNVVGSLPNLQELKVQKSDFVGIDSVQTKREWEPKEGEFSQLLSLGMVDLDLEHWRAHATHFPRLQQLIVHHCYAMVEIPLDIGDITTLELMQVDKGSPSALVSAMQIKEKQESLGNKLLQVQVTRTT